VAAGSLALVAATLVGPAPVAQAAGPVVCTATGGTITNDVTIDGIRYNIHVFNSSGTFTPAQATRVDYLVVGGGGGGGGGRGTTGGTRGMGGGGGGGAVVTGSLELTASGHSITRGNGGTAGTVTTIGGTGATSSIGAFVTAAGGGGGGAAGGTGLGGNGASGGGGSGDDVARAGGTASAGNAGGTGSNGGGTFANRAGGGGGGAGGAAGNAASAVGGAGGAGVSSSITGSAQTYGGGGGGGGTTAGAGNGGGGNGSTNGNATAGSANRGGGGGGARSSTTTSRTGGAGGTGVVIIRYPRFCLNPSPPTSVAFANPTMSWGAPVYVPASQTVTSYTITYRQSGDTSSGNIYARGSSATSLNITGVDQAACSSNNPGWTCDASINLVSGESYEFRVFARTASSLGQMSGTVPYTVP
jgi:hypothetical protein